jgi:hypothetical protein
VCYPGFERVTDKCVPKPGSTRAAEVTPSPSEASAPR